MNPTTVAAAWYVRWMPVYTCPDPTFPTRQRIPPATSMWPLEVFMAGGITNCPNWQELAAQWVADIPAVFYNPRRADYDPANGAVLIDQQIEWEHERLERADAVMFWFPGGESLCPITLYELGTTAKSDQAMFVGCHPRYQRRYDVIKQLSLRRPDVTVVDSLMAVIQQAAEWVGGPWTPPWEVTTVDAETYDWLVAQLDDDTGTPIPGLVEAARATRENPAFTRTD